MTALKTEQTTIEQTVESEEGEQILLDKVLEQTCQTLDRTASRYALALKNVEGHVRRSLILAQGIQRLRGLLNKDVMKEFMALQGSTLGFVTDRDTIKDGKGGKVKGPGYPEEIVKECLIEALLLGLYPVNNEFNIIAGKCYPAQHGYIRLVREIPGISDLDVVPGVPQAASDKNPATVVRCGATWRLNGIPFSLKDAEGRVGRVFTIRVNEGMGPDAIIGKALKKTYQAIYTFITGSDLSRPEEEDGESSSTPRTPPASKTEEVALALGVKPSNGTAVAEEVQQGDAPGTMFPNTPDVGEGEDDSERQGILNGLRERLKKVATVDELKEIGRDMLRNRDAIGETDYKGLIDGYREAEPKLALANQPAKPMGPIAAARKRAGQI